MAQDTGGLHQRTDILGEGTSIHLQAANLHIADLGRIAEGTPGAATDGAPRRRIRHHQLNVMTDTRAKIVGSEVQGPL